MHYERSAAHERESTQLEPDEPIEPRTEGVPARKTSDEERSPQRLVDLVSLDLLQKVQDNFSAAVGVAIVIVDETGEPLTKPSGFSAFCQAARVVEALRDSCFRCDDVGGRMAFATGEPAIYRCHCGLVDFSAPIIMRGQYLGAVVSGQVMLKDDESHPEVKPVIPSDDLWRKNHILSSLREDINQISYDKLRSTAYSLFYLAAYLVEESYAKTMNKELYSKNLRLMEESKKRVELEKSLQEAELQALSYQVNPHFLFNVLNTIGRLALVEGADSTEKTVHAFAEMMRYVLKKSGSQIVSLKSELTHVRNYLYIQKLRMGNRLTFEINVPDEYDDVHCPFMVLHPMVENCLHYAIEPRESGGVVEISAYDDGKEVILDIVDNGEGVEPEIVRRALEGIADHHGRISIGIHNVDSRLRYFFGDDRGLQVDSPLQNGRGTRVRIRLPLNFDPNAA